MNMNVSMNFAIPTQTRALGEDLFELEKIARAIRLLEARLKRAKVTSEIGVDYVASMLAGLDDAKHDASHDWTFERANAAADEAHVRKIDRIVRLAHPAPLANICPICGADLDELNTSKNARDRGEVRCNTCERACVEQ
jgi:hypothetical protein